VAGRLDESRAGQCAHLARCGGSHPMGIITRVKIFCKVWFTSQREFKKDADSSMVCMVTCIKVAVIGSHDISREFSLSILPPNRTLPNPLPLGYAVLQIRYETRSGKVCSFHVQAIQSPESRRGNASDGCWIIGGYNVYNPQPPLPPTNELAGYFRHLIRCWVPIVRLLLLTGTDCPL
jgi:hypothetical protein